MYDLISPQAASIIHWVCLVAALTVVLLYYMLWLATKPIDWSFMTEEGDPT